MGLSGCVTSFLYILRYINNRKKNSPVQTTIKTHTTIVTSDSSEGDEMKPHHSTIVIQSKK